MKHLTKVIAIASPVILSLASCSHKSTEGSEGGSVIDVAEPVVRSITLYNDYPGYLGANQSVDVVAKVNGQILKKLYESGGEVKEGQPLFKIDPSIYQDKVDQAQASLATAIADRDYAREHYHAVKKAAESDAVSKMEVVQSESALAEAEASVKTAQAQLAEARRNLGYCTVVAPISGVASTNLVGEGNYVTGDGAPVKLATIYDNSSMTANFAIEDERYLELIRSQEARRDLRLDSVPVTFSENLPHTYTGSITYFAPNLQQTTGTMKVQCKIPNPWNELRDGMYVKVHLPYGYMEDAVMVRASSIGTDQLGHYLYVVNDSNKVVYTPVTLGPTYGDSLRVVTKGIRPGDRYVTKAMLKMRDGVTVKPRLVK